MASSTTASTEKGIRKCLYSGSNELKIVVVGQTGVGKSTLLNAIIGEEVAEAKSSPMLVTEDVVEYTIVINGISVSVFDTPGFDDSDKDDEETVAEIRQKTKGVIDLVMICFDIRQRLNKIQLEAFNNLKTLLTNESETQWDRVFIVLTHANEISEEEFRYQYKYMEEVIRVFITKPAYGGLSEEMAKKIPIVPAGFKYRTLHGIKDWLLNIWWIAFRHINRKQVFAQLIEHRSDIDIGGEASQVRSLASTLYSNIGDYFRYLWADRKIVKEWLYPAPGQLKIVIIGRRGVGKSTLLHGILGQDVAKCFSGAVTDAVKFFKSTQSGVKVQVLYMLGFDDQTIDGKKTIKEVMKPEVDMILVCLEVNQRVRRIDMSVFKDLNDYIIQKKEDWSRVLVVLAELNPLKLFAVDVDKCIKAIHDFSIEKEFGGLDSTIAQDIPIVPAGHWNPALPGIEDWVFNLWRTAFEYLGGRKEFLRLAEHRNAHLVEEITPNGENKQELDHLEVYQKALKDRKTISLQYLKFFLVGIPRIGKTTTKLRLVEKMVNIKEADDRYKNLDSTTAAEWSYVKTNLTTVTTGNKLWSIMEDEKEELLQLYRQAYKISKDDNIPRKKMEQHNVPSVDPCTVTNPEEGEVECDIPGDDEADTVKEPAMHIAESQTDDEQVDTKVMPDNIPKDIEEIIKNLEHDFLSADIKETDLVRMLSVIDVGGQSAFLKMLPLLINGPALYSVFFSLMQHLDSPYYDTLVRDGKEYKPKRKTEATVRDVLIQILSSVALSNYQSNKVESELKKLSLSHNKVCATSFIIGTFKDKLIESVQNHESEINSIDKNFQKLVDEVFESVDPKPVSYAKCGDDEEKRLIFAIDNMNGTKKEIEELRDRLTEEMENKFANLEVPIRWLIFGILLRKEYEWITKSDCESLAQILYIKKEDVDTVLWFFSVIAGMFLYQPDLKESLLSEVIICNQQVLFNSITELIEYPVKHDQSSLQSLTKHGQFSLETLEELFARRHKIDDFDLTHSLRREKTSKDPLIPITDLVKLLEHRNVVSQISDKEYFMPAVLDGLTEEEFKQYKLKNSPRKDPCPLFIKFKCGYVPPGLFCAVMTKFMKEKKWVKNEAKCNFICFKVTFENRPVHLMIMAHTESYEICIWGCGKRISLKKLCHYINIIIDKAINEALCHQEDVKSYEFCIECPECKKLTVIKSDVYGGETVIICQNFNHDNDISEDNYTCWIYDQHCDSSPISTEANDMSEKEPAKDGRNEETKNMPEQQETEKEIGKRTLSLLIEHRIELEKAVTLDITWLAHEMNKIGLLPSSIHKDVIDSRSMLTKAAKATEMIGALETLVNLNPINLDRFVDILRKQPVYNDIVQLLTQDSQNLDAHGERNSAMEDNTESMKKLRTHE